jgi:hypothetical protein
MNPRRGILAGLTILAAATLATGCAGPVPTPTASGQRLAPSLIALYQQTLERERSRLTPFELDVLERAAKTGHIDPADYEEATNRRSACIKDAGYTETIKKLPNGIYQIAPVMPTSGDVNKWANQYSDKDKECSKGTVMIIEALYTTERGNPNLLHDPLEVAVQCLKQESLVPATFKAKDLEGWLANSQPPLPFDAGDPRAQTCFSNAGIAVSVEG